MLLGVGASLSACVETQNYATRFGSPVPDSLSISSRSSIPDDLETSMQVYLTGYSFWDNTPPGSAQIARPVIHSRAGGIGTYSDPITLAVGHAKFGSHSRMDFPTGTRFYVPSLKKYAIVEDLCGDGPLPQNGPCHSGHQGLPWIDIYVGGRSVDKSAVNKCMYSITGIQSVLVNPAAGHPVVPGEIATSTCRL